MLEMTKAKIEISKEKYEMMLHKLEERKRL